MGGDLKKDDGSSKLKFDDDDFESIPPMNQPRAEIKGEDLRLRHRIGRGLFGDVWLGTLHSHREEFDEHHEVAIKVLPSLAEEQVGALTAKLEHIFSSTQGARSISWPLGFSVKDSKISIISKVFESSIHDKMARLPENTLPLDDVLRYGASIVQALLELHSHGLLCLNLKPSNFFLDEHGQVVLGEFGIPFLMMDTITKGSSVTWLGTPNYMAPEQWDASLRGPVSFQTDSWGFGCSIMEMLTGTRPWNHMSAGDIFHTVVERREKPVVPRGLPPALQKVLKGCFEYDYRNRPTASEILSAMTSPHLMFKEGDWVAVSGKPRKQGMHVGVVKKVKSPESLVVLYCDKPEEPVEYTGLGRCSTWSPFQVGDRVKLKPSVSLPTFSWGEYANSMATITATDHEKALFLVKFNGSDETFQADPAQLDLVCDGNFLVGDSVRLREGWPASSGKSPSSVGVIHGTNKSRDAVKVAFLGLPTLWEGKASGVLSKVAPVVAGQFVRLKNEVVEPRYEWPVRKNQCWETGRVVDVLPNGALCVDFPGRLWNRKPCFADADEVEVVRFNECDGLVGKYEHLQAVHWAIAPALCLLGFLAAARVGTVFGSLVLRPLKKRGSNKSSDTSSSSSLEITEYCAGDKGVPPGGGNPVWLPPAVASILFKEA